jgi:hypothetical protein
VASIHTSQLDEDLDGGVVPKAPLEEDLLYTDDPFWVGTVGMFNGIDGAGAAVVDMLGGVEMAFWKLCTAGCCEAKVSRTV